MVTSETAAATRIAAGTRRGAIADIAFRALTFFFALAILLILGGVIATLIAGALPAFEAFGPGFLVADVWNPVTERFGALAPVYGTVATAAMAMLIGIPVAFGIALSCTELSPPWLKRPRATMIEL